MKKFIKTLAASLAIAATATMMVPAQGASAATYQTSLERGVKYLCYTKDSVTWTTNSSQITDYEGEQTRSGLFVELKGISKKKTLSSSTKFALLCKHTFLVGAEVSGVTLGYNTDINDMLYINKSGQASVTWDY